MIENSPVIKQISTRETTKYFDGRLSDIHQDESSDLAVGIMAQFSDAILKEKYIQWDYPKPLPESNYWAYQSATPQGGL